jgi:hypothetical protein
MIITMGKGNPFFPQKKEWPAHGAGSLTHLALVLAGLLSHPLRSPRQILLSVASVETRGWRFVGEKNEDWKERKTLIIKPGFHI